MKEFAKDPTLLRGLGAELYRSRFNVLKCKHKFGKNWKNTFFSKGNYFMCLKDTYIMLYTVEKVLSRALKR